MERFGIWWQQSQELSLEEDWGWVGVRKFLHTFSHCLAQPVLAGFLGLSLRKFPTGLIVSSADTGSTRLADTVQLSGSHLGVFEKTAISSTFSCSESSFEFSFSFSFPDF